MGNNKTKKPRKGPNKTQISAFLIHEYKTHRGNITKGKKRKEKRKEKETTSKKDDEAHEQGDGGNGVFLLDVRAVTMTKLHIYLEYVRNDVDDRIVRVHSLAEASYLALSVL